MNTNPLQLQALLSYNVNTMNVCFTNRNLIYSHLGMHYINRLRLQEEKAHLIIKGLVLLVSHFSSLLIVTCKLRREEDLV